VADGVLVRVDPGAVNALARDDAEVVDLLFVLVGLFGDLLQRQLLVIEAVVFVVAEVIERGVRFVLFVVLLLVVGERS